MDPEKAIFISEGRLLSDAEIPKLTSFASLSELKSVIPDSLCKNESLVPFAGNLVLINQANGNGHLISTETALAHYKLFEHGRVDLEHGISDKVCGHIVSAFLTEYDENYKIGEGSKVIGEEDVKGTNKPFNIAVVGVIYKGSIPGAINKIIESSDPKSDNYLDVSLSWETQYTTSDILLGHSIENGKIISDETEKISYQKYLKGSNGSGKLKDGTPVNLLLTGEIVPLGLGITLNPASQVKGIVVPDSILEKHKEEKEETEDSESNIEEIAANLPQTNQKEEKSENNISQLGNDSVNKLDNKNIADSTSPKIKIMKFLNSYAELEKITDDDLQKGEVSLANLNKVFQDEIKKANDKWVAEVNAEKTATAEAKQKSEAAEKNALEAKDAADKLSKEVENLKSAIASKEADEKYSARMSKFDEVYELDANDRKVLAKRVKNVSDEDFAEVESDFAILFAAKNKDFMKKMKEEKEKKDGKKDGKKDEKEVVKAALDKAEIEKETVPSASSEEQTLGEKYKDAFKNIVVKNK